LLVAGGTRRAAADFALAYDENVSRIYAFVAYRLGSREDAEDLTQLTFERALKAWGRYDSRKGSITTWLLSIARNVVIDHHRGRRPTEWRVVDDREADAVRGHEPDPSERLGIDADLEDALRTLDDRERELIALRFGGDMTGADIAAVTGLTLANVQQILSRSLRRIRAFLDASARAQEFADQRSAARAGRWPDDDGVWSVPDAGSAETDGAASAPSAPPSDSGSAGLTP
jgi:RNA polymerase sigma factor (sigma-70 family)